VGVDQVPRAAADALQPLVDLLQGPEPVPLLEQLVAGRLQLLLRDGGLLADLLQLPLQAAAELQGLALLLLELAHLRREVAAPRFHLVALAPEGVGLHHQLLAAPLELGAAAGGGGQPCLGGRHPGLGLGPAGPEVGQGLLRGLLLGAELVEALLGGDDGLHLAALGGVGPGELFFQGLPLPGDGRHLLGEIPLLGLRLPLPGLERGQPLPGLGDLRLQGLDEGAGGVGLALGLLGLLLEAVGLLPEHLQLRLPGGQLGDGGLAALGQLQQGGALDLEQHGQLQEAVAGLVEQQVIQLGAVAPVALGLLRLALEGGHAALDLRDDVADPGQVLPGQLHLLLGLLAPVLVLGDARGLLDEQAAILRPRGHDQPHLALLDDRVRLRPHPGAEEQVGDVLEPYLGLVDQVLARPVPVEPAGHGDLGVVPVLQRQRLGPFRIRVVEGDGHLRQPHRPPRRRPREDHVDHRLAPQVLGGLLSDAPPQRVHDVRLPAAVRPHDPQHVVVKLDHRPVHKRLEPGDLELLDPHPEPAPDSPEQSSSASPFRCRIQGFGTPPRGVLTCP
jgi:hypothetical protein